MAIVTLTINGEQVSAKDDETLLQIARQHKIDILTLCHLDGLSDVGACRLCLVEIEGSSKLVPACTARPIEGMVVRTDTERLKKYRRMIIALLASEGNHQCAVCMVNNHCELQNLAYDVGLLYVRVPYLYNQKKIDASHETFARNCEITRRAGDAAPAFQLRSRYSPSRGNTEKARTSS